MRDLVERAGRLADEARGAGRRSVLGITGPPGVGKSTLGAALVDALGADTAVLVGMDGFHLSNAVLEAHGSSARKGAVDTFDDAGYAALIARIADQVPGDPPVFAPVFHREIEEPVAAGIAVGDQPLVITEGNYLLTAAGAWPAASARMVEVWYLDVPDAERLRRLVARHQAFGRSPADAEAWAGGTDQRNADRIAATRDAADLIVELV